MKKKKEFDKSILILFSIVALTVVTAISLYFSVRVDVISQTLKNRDVLNFLVVIEDDKGNPALSQVVMINTETNKGALIDVPTNLGTIMPSKKRYVRMDYIYKEYGIELYKERIEQLLSLTIPHYISINHNSFSEVVDLLGGLDLFVSKSFDTESDDLLIPSGSIVLEGDKVDLYLDTIMGDEHNSSLLNRKQKLVQSFISQITKLSPRLLLNNNLDKIYNRLETNLDYSSFTKLIDYLSNLLVDRLVLQGILGDTKPVNGEEFIFPYNNGNLIKVRIKRILKTLGDAEVISDEKLNFNLEVLNGTNNQGLASRTSSYLSSFGGYTISNIGNADKEDEYQYTEIWDLKGNLEAAERLGELLNCKRIHSGYQEGLDDTIDFTIILGKDFDGKRVKD